MSRLYPNSSLYRRIYFDCVIGTDGVVYYYGVLSGGIQTETAGGTSHLSICLGEKYRRKGIAEASLNQLFLAQAKNMDLIEISIDRNYSPSLELFAKLGFRQFSQD